MARFQVHWSRGPGYEILDTEEGLVVFRSESRGDTQEEADRLNSLALNEEGEV